MLSCAVRDDGRVYHVVFVGNGRKLVYDREEPWPSQLNEEFLRLALVKVSKSVNLMVTKTVK